MSIGRADVEAGRIDLMEVVDGHAAPIGPIHPGVTLLEDFLKPMGITPYRLAKEIHVPSNRITEIINGRRDITADTALRLARYFGTDAQSWINLQTGFDLECANAELADTLRLIRPAAA